MNTITLPRIASIYKHTTKLNNIFSDFNDFQKQNFSKCFKQIYIAASNQELEKNEAKDEMYEFE